eukprot:scaffold318688_cov42-Prasinocladus_malaysianus.AAC.2
MSYSAYAVVNTGSRTQHSTCTSTDSLERLHRRADCAVMVETVAISSSFVRVISAIKLDR